MELNIFRLLNSKSCWGTKSKECYKDQLVDDATGQLGRSWTYGVSRQLLSNISLYALTWIIMDTELDILNVSMQQLKKLQVSKKIGQQEQAGSYGPYENTKRKIRYFAFRTFKRGYKITAKGISAAFLRVLKHIKALNHEYLKLNSNPCSYYKS